jgi:hypothetical protein
VELTIIDKVTELIDTKYNTKELEFGTNHPRNLESAGALGSQGR